MIRPLNRRRFLTISAAAMAVPAAASAAPVQAHWRGTALGAGASLKLVGLDDVGAARVFRAVEAELSRLESIFSLYREDSALSQLNTSGQLDGPPAELLEVLTLAGAVNASTGGAFDPTVQPLWTTYAETGGGPDTASLEAARARVGWGNLRMSSGSVRFEQPGMALTLNGIAQGYITDRIAALLKESDLKDVLIDMGEIVGLGERAEGGAWKAGIATPDGQIVERISLSDRALATSAPLGTVLDEAGAVGHILNPINGLPARAHSLVSVSADSAALADALSTAFCAMERTAITSALNAHKSAQLEYIA